jgi:hypothetical protein
MNSVSICAECECENVAHKIGTTKLFEHIHSGHINQSLKNAACTQASS